jgi:hypothetical protein
MALLIDQLSADLHQRRNRVLRGGDAHGTDKRDQ